MHTLRVNRFNITNDYKIVIHNFPSARSAIKGQCVGQGDKFTCCAIGKGS